MPLHLEGVTEENFNAVIQLKSDQDQEKRFQIFERWVGSNTYFLALSHVYGFISKAIYDGTTLIGFVTHGYDQKRNRYELISMMIGHQFQGKGYGSLALNLVIEEMVNLYKCKEIYLSVIYDNETAIRVYEKAGFVRTGEVEQGHHPEPIYCLSLT